MEKKSKKNLYQRFVDFVDENKLFRLGDRVVIAVSGGPDSICLFYLLLELSRERNIKLLVAHYNHSLRGREAVRDEKFVEEVTLKEGIPFVTERAKEGQIKGEEAARNFRYRFLEKTRGEWGGDWIATAHNMNDLSETLLLNLVRGTGIRGLKSMPLVREHIVRPLLFAKRLEIEKYLREKKIESRHDKSNDSPIFARNFIRHQILPQLEKLNPKVIESLERTAKIASIYDDFVREISSLELKKIRKKEGNSTVLERKKFLCLSPAVQSEIVRILAEEAGIFTDISAVHIEEVLSMIGKNVGKKYKVLAKRLKFTLAGGKIIVSKTRG